MPDNVIREWVEQVTINNVRLRERQLRLVIQPRPKWLPEWAWRRLIGRLLVVEERDA